jgi:hypothetical protein
MLMRDEIALLKADLRAFERRFRRRFFLLCLPLYAAMIVELLK